MCPDDVGNLRCRRQRTDNGRRPGAERREDLGGDRGVSLVAGMEPVGAPEITRPAVVAVEVIDAVEPIQTDERSAVPRSIVTSAGGAAVTEPSSGIAQAALAPLRATRLRFIPSLSATSAGKVPSGAVAKRPALMLSPRAT